MDPHLGEPERDELLRRLKSSYLASSQTLLSIIQGVALASLAAVVASSYRSFAPVQWLYTALTFLLLVAVWNQISIESLTWVLVPDFLRSIIPFLVGAAELYLVQAINLGAVPWLIGMAALALFSSVGIRTIERQASAEPENAQLIAYLKPFRRAGNRYNVAGSVLVALLALAGALGGFAAADTRVRMPAAAEIVSALLTGMWLVGFMLRHVFYWRVVVAYAKREPSPATHRAHS